MEKSELIDVSEKNENFDRKEALRNLLLVINHDLADVPRRGGAAELAIARQWLRTVTGEQLLDVIRSAKNVVIGRL